MKRNPKVILLGESNVGKTSIIQVLLHGQFPQKMANTLGACFHRYDCEVNGEKTTMDIWDTAGQERYRSLLTLYYKNSDAVVIVFDTTDGNSFRAVEYWAKQIQESCQNSPCKYFWKQGIILVGNKADLKPMNSGVKQYQISSYLQKKPKWKYFDCSAKTGLNISTIFTTLSKLIKEKETSNIKTQSTSKFKMESKNRKNREKSGSCC